MTFYDAFTNEMDKIAKAKKKMVKCPVTGKMIPKEDSVKRKGRRLGRGGGKGPLGNPFLGKGK